MNWKCLASVAALVLLSMDPVVGATTKAGDSSAAGTVRGTVVCGTETVAYAWVIVLGTRIGGQTDEHGRFLIRNVPQGQQTLRVQALGCEPSTVALHVGAGMDPSVLIRMRCRNMFSEEALKPCGGLVWRASHPSTGLTGCGEDLASGRFEELGVGDGRVRVSMRRRHCQLRIDWWMPEGSKLDICVLDERGQVRRLLRRGRASSAGLDWDGKDERGKFLPWGAYRLRFESAGKVAELLLYRVGAETAVHY